MSFPNSNNFEGDSGQNSTARNHNDGKTNDENIYHRISIGESSNHSENLQMNQGNDFHLQHQHTQQQRNLQQLQLQQQLRNNFQPQNNGQPQQANNERFGTGQQSNHIADQASMSTLLQRGGQSLNQTSFQFQQEGQLLGQQFYHGLERNPEQHHVGGTYHPGPEIGAQPQQVRQVSGGQSSSLALFEDFEPVPLDNIKKQLSADDVPHTHDQELQRQQQHREIKNHQQSVQYASALSPMDIKPNSSNQFNSSTSSSHFTLGCLIPTPPPTPPPHAKPFTNVTEASLLSSSSEQRVQLSDNSQVPQTGDDIERQIQVNNLQIQFLHGQLQQQQQQQQQHLLLKQFLHQYQQQRHEGSTLAPHIPSQMQPPQHLPPTQSLSSQDIDQQLIANQRIIEQMQLQLKVRAKPPADAGDNSHDTISAEGDAGAVIGNYKNEITPVRDEATQSGRSSQGVESESSQISALSSLIGHDTTGQTCIATQLAAMKLSEWIDVKKKEEIQKKERCARSQTESGSGISPTSGYNVEVARVAYLIGVELSRVLRYDSPDIHRMSSGDVNPQILIRLEESLMSENIKLAVEVQIMASVEKTGISAGGGSGDSQNPISESTRPDSTGIQSDSAQRPRDDNETNDVDVPLGMGFFSSIVPDNPMLDSQFIERQRLLEEKRRIKKKELREEERRKKDEIWGEFNPEVGMGFFSKLTANEQKHSYRLTQSQDKRSRHWDQSYTSFKEESSDNCSPEIFTKPKPSSLRIDEVIGVEVDVKWVQEIQGLTQNPHRSSMPEMSDQDKDDEYFDLFESLAVRSFARVVFEMFTRGEKLPNRRNRHADADKGAIDTGLYNNNGDDDENSRYSKHRRRRNEPKDALSTKKCPWWEDELEDYSYDPYLRLRDAGASLTISRWVVDLLLVEKSHASTHFIEECSEDIPPTSLMDIVSDMKQMINCPERFLHANDCDDGVSIGKSIEFVDCLYGRRKEIDTLFDTISRVSSQKQLLSQTPDYYQTQAKSQREFVLISGHSGSGKSSLIRSFKNPLRRSGWCYLSCKFERMDNTTPLQTLASAFDEFCLSLITMRDHYLGVRKCYDTSTFWSWRDVSDYLDYVTQSIKTAVGESNTTALDLFIPSLHKLLNASQATRDDTTSSRVTNFTDSSRTRVSYLFCSLLSAISHPSHPALLLLDDLQWADTASSEIIGDIMKFNDENGNDGRFVVVGIYRDNEVNDSHPLAVKVRELDHEPNINITKIALGGMVEDDVNEMISESLQLPIRLTRSLSKVVHKKTDGNPLFVVEFLRSLVKEKLLYFSLTSKRWSWEADVIDLKCLKDDVAELLTRKLLNLPPKMLEGLKRASCFGSQIYTSTLLCLSDLKSIDSESIDVMGALELGAECGLIERSVAMFQFSHDLIQQAAYELIPAIEQPIYHKMLGGVLVAQSVRIGLDDTILFVAADQVNRAGVQTITDSKERILFAGLNLKAASKSMEQSEYDSALTYLESGLTFLTCIPDHWDTEYELSLNLFQKSAQVQYMHGNINESMKYIGEVLERSSNFNDRLEVFHVLVKSLGSSGAQLEAIEKGVLVLEELGESFPFKITPKSVLNYLMKIEKELRDYDKDRILHLPLIQDSSKYQALKFLSLIFLFAARAKPEFIPFISCRIVELTLRHGICQYSVAGFAALGTIMISVKGDVEAGYQLGKFSSSLLRKFDSDVVASQVAASVYGVINVLVEPAQANIERLLSGYRRGLLGGNIEMAMTNIFLYCRHSFFFGKELNRLQSELMHYMRQMDHYKQEMYRKNMANTNELIAILTTGRVEQLQSFFCESTTQSNVIPQAIAFNYLIAAFIFREFEFAMKLCEIYKHEATKAWRIQDIIQSFYEGLLAYGLARQRSDRNLIAVADKATDVLVRCAGHSKWNFENKMKLLQAEKFFTNNQIDEAREAFESSIKSAQAHKFIHEEAIALELAAYFYAAQNDYDKTKSHLQMSSVAYRKWGANVKAESLTKLSIQNDN